MVIEGPVIEMKALLVYPEYPETFWNFKHALKFTSKKAVYPPLGLITMAAILPSDWDIKLVDMNVTALTDADLQWADIVMVSAMSIQTKSVREVASRCKSFGVKTVAGGPLFTSIPDEFTEFDYLVLGEAEVILPQFINDLEKGEAKHKYEGSEWADMTKSPIPRWDLIDSRKYVSMNIQASRGCPYDCEFCNITTLYGRKPRYKNVDQIIAELDSLWNMGWKGGVFFVDDNFIGNKVYAKKELLPAIIEWQNNHGHPFVFNSQVTINLADDPELMRMMTDAGFATVFIGIESPNDESLQECNKIPNKQRDLMRSVKTIQASGIQVQAGFIVGFDNDPPSIFDRMISFIQESGIVTAMVGLLNAPYGTRLYAKLKEEGRLLSDLMTGDNTDSTTNIVPAMNYDNLIAGYRKIVEYIYSPNVFYQRIKEFLRVYQPVAQTRLGFKLDYIPTIFKATFRLGFIEKERVYWWRLFFWSLFKKPKLLPMAMTFAAYGFHFRKSFEICRPVS